MHLTQCVCNKMLAPLYAGQTISSTLMPQSAAELTAPRGTNTKNCFVGQNKSKIGFNEHADSYLPKKKQNLVLSNQHAGFSYQPKKKQNLVLSNYVTHCASHTNKLLTPLSDKQEVFHPTDASNIHISNPFFIFEILTHWNTTNKMQVFDDKAYLFFLLYDSHYDTVNESRTNCYIRR